MQMDFLLLGSSCTEQAEVDSRLIRLRIPRALSQDLPPRLGIRKLSDFSRLGQQLARRGPRATCSRGGTLGLYGRWLSGALLGEALHVLHVLHLLQGSGIRLI